MLALRWITSLAVATGIAFGLFVGMNWVILSSDALKVEENTRKIIDFVQVKTQQQVMTNERVRPEKPQQPQSAPPMDIIPDFDAGEFDVASGSLDLGQVDLGNTIDIAGGIALGPVEEDAEYLPLVKVQPQYPPAAAQRGIEGYVVVEYTVTKNGRTKDLKVVEANPVNVFERAALGAASRFKYNPKIVDGEPVEVEGVQNRFNFKLQK